MYTNTQYVPEFINECILKLKDGIAEKDRIFDLLGIRPLDNIKSEPQYIRIGVNPNKKNYQNVWIEKKELESEVEKEYQTCVYSKSQKENYIFRCKLKDLDRDIENLVTNNSETAIEIVETYFKKHYIAKKAIEIKPREVIDIVKKHFCRDVPKKALNTILSITEEAKTKLMDNHYKRQWYDYKEYKYSQAPWREEYISEEEFSDLKEAIWWCSYNKKVRKEKWSAILQNFFKKRKLKMRKKTNNDGKILYDYSSIEPDIDYKALYRSEVTHFPAYDWNDIEIDNYNNTYLSDEMVELYMKKFNPEIYFLHKHAKIVDANGKQIGQY